MKTIKDIAYDCADTLNFADKEKHYRYQRYRKAGDYWGDIAINKDLSKNLLSKIDTDIKVYGETFVAFFAEMEFKEAPGFNRDFWCDFFMSQGSLVNPKAKQWLYLEKEDGEIMGYSIGLEMDSLNVRFENWKELKIWQNKERLNPFQERLPDKVLEEKYKDLDYMVIYDQDRRLILKATRISFSTPHTRKRQKWAYLIKDKNIWHHYDYEPLEYVLKRALKIEGILKDNQKKYVKDALRAIQLKEVELKNKNIQLTNEAITAMDKEISTHKYAVLSNP